MAIGLDRSEVIRAALYRKGLADARQRAAVARRLGVTDSEVVAIQHLARAGELTPGRLGALLQLSSGGVTGLVQRLQRAGHVTRHPSAIDRRSAVVRLSPAVAAQASELWAPFVEEIDERVSDLSEYEREVVRRFLEATADAAERHSNRFAHDAAAAAQDQLAVPLPALWS